MRGDQVEAILIKNFFTNNFRRASWLSSPNLATFLLQFGHVWEAIFSQVFLTELFHHISFGCFHYNFSNAKKKKFTSSGSVLLCLHPLALMHWTPHVSSLCAYAVRHCTPPVKPSVAMQACNISWWKTLLEFTKTCFSEVVNMHRVVVHNIWWKIRLELTKKTIFRSQ